MGNDYLNRDKVRHALARRQRRFLWLFFLNRSPCEIGNKLPSQPAGTSGMSQLPTQGLRTQFRRAQCDITFLGETYPWAVEFDGILTELIVAGDHDSLIAYERLPNTKLAIPTNEHYLPMLYALALKEETDTLVFTCSDMQNGSISMRSFIIDEVK